MRLKIDIFYTAFDVLLYQIPQVALYENYMSMPLLCCNILIAVGLLKWELGRQPLLLKQNEGNYIIRKPCNIQEEICVSVVDWPWLEIRHPPERPCHSPLQLDWGEKTQLKVCGLRYGPAETSLTKYHHRQNMYKTYTFGPVFLFTIPWNSSTYVCDTCDERGGQERPWSVAGLWVCGRRIIYRWIREVRLHNSDLHGIHILKSIIGSVEVK